MAVSIHVVGGPDAGTRLDVEGTVEIGREAELPAGRLGDDQQLSRRHARLRREADGSVSIEDLGSSNGTRVNGYAVTAPTGLRDGDRIEVGGTVLDVREELAATPAPTPVLAPLPAFGAPAEMQHVATRRRGASTLTAALVTGLILAVAAVAVLLVRDGDSAQGASGTGDWDGTVYVESNNPEPFGNSVLAFRYNDGSFRPMSVREYPTGGAGAQDLTNSGALDIEGSIATSTDRKLLFAVNAQSDTIAVFHIRGDGSLRPVEGSPFPSQGAGPASVDYRDGHLFVANKAHDGRRDLRQVAPNYASFDVEGDGSLKPVGLPQPLPPQSSPTQAFVDPDGDFLMGTAERGVRRYQAGPLLSYKIEDDGSLKPAPSSPYKMDDQILNLQAPDEPAWAQGFVALPEERLIYAGVANLRRLVVYSYDDRGRLTFVKQMHNNGAILPCWTEMSKDRRFLYTGNAGNNTISVFDIHTDPRNPRQIQNFKLQGGGNPWNFELDPSGKYFFLVNIRSADFVPRGDGNNLHTLAIGANGKLSEPPYSPVPLPVAIDTNPWGIAIVPRHR